MSKVEGNERATSPNVNFAHIASFAIGITLLGVSGGIYGTTFNNFLSDEFNMGSIERGQLELPRELPGFLCALLSGALHFLSEPKATAVASLLIAVGMAMLPFTGGNYAMLIIALLFWSSGTHLTQPFTSSIAMQLAPPHSRGTLLGRLRALDAVAMIVGCTVVWWALERWRYEGLFTVAALSATLSALAFTSLPDLRGKKQPRPKFVWDRRYGLFYLLNIFFGARKQLFLTFGPWVLVRIFKQPASTFARLWIISAPLTALFNPAVGRLVDKWGERTVLMLDAGLLTIVCLAYAFASRIPFGLYIAFSCYILDQLLFVTGIARATYLKKIAKDEDDVTASLSLGVSLDHAVSMSLPWLAGYIWARYGHEYVFLIAAALSLVNMLAASFVNVTQADSGSARERE
ncbi:MAG: MFS transporter [Armatimonadota bacterium]|nr:MFS transporter [Armatimonadota bacterium]MCX7778035.1 MFS transporter [Armatimonadota bacterium]MDW8024967.1 MFS transporter [Armatimonadota bacterium]